MRILYFSTSYPPYVSGTAVFVFNLATKMAELGHKVAVIAPSMNSWVGRKKTGDLTEYFLPSISNPLRQFHTLFWVSPDRVKKIITEFKPDIIHYNDLALWPFSIAPWARSQGVPLVVTQHGMLGYAIYFFPLAKLILPILVNQLRRALELFDLVTVPSQTMQRHLVSDIGLPANQTQVISNGVDCQHFSINKISLNVTRPVKKMTGKNRLGLTVSNLANQPLKILFVGRFEIEKALLILLRALAKVEIPVKLRLVGGGGQLAALKQTVKGLGLDQKVEFVMAMPEKELLEQYRWADIFVMPSPMESQSIVTLQAMACSLPVIGANTGALPELVMPSKTGWLFKSDDLNDLAKKIELAANQDLRQKYGFQARKHALKHNAGAVYQTWLKLYRNLLS